MLRFRRPGEEHGHRRDPARRPAPLRRACSSRNAVRELVCQIKAAVRRATASYFAYPYLVDPSDLPSCYALWEADECLHEVWREFELARFRQQCEEAASADRS
jgi:hypothetical protein